MFLVGCSPVPGKPASAQPTRGLKESACWFTNTLHAPDHRCYYMTVDETPGRNNGRTVSFPVIVFSSPDGTSNAGPLLHLGGGGPGASLYLDSEYNVLSIYEQMHPLSIGQGRDLVLIDPRGAGQSTPRLMCKEFVDNVISRWQRNMSIRESYDEGHENFNQCLDTLTKSGMDFTAFSSRTVVDDLEQLRTAMGVGQWVLYGASYASVYAQLYTRDYPDRIDSMILDSATFLDTPRHEVLVREFTEPFKRLFSYCQVAAGCVADDSRRIETRFWNLVRLLDRKPVRVEVSLTDNEPVVVVLTGWRFLDSMLWGVYEEKIFSEFPKILDELERGETRTVRPYVEDLLAYLLDETFGDISASSHFCIDRKPYENELKIKEAIERIPYAYARDIARLGLEYADYCAQMSIPPAAEGLDKPVVTDVPTLFIHGELDSITLLDHVNKRRLNFSNSHLVTSAQAHIVLDDPCIRKTTARFVQYGVTRGLATRCPTQ